MKNYPGVYPIEGKPNKWLLKIRYSIRGRGYQTTRIVTTNSEKQAYNMKIRITDEEKALRNRGIDKERFAKLTFYQLVDKWKETEYKDLSPTTQKGYDSILNYKLLPYFGTMRVVKIDEIELYQFIDKSREDGDQVSQSTIRNWLMLMRTLMSFAKRRKVISENPFDYFEMKKAETKEITCFEDTQLIKMLQVLDRDVEERKRSFENSAKYKKLDDAERKRKENIRLLDANMKRLFVNLAIVSGARRGEIAGLKTSNIDLVNKRITFRGTAYFEKGQGSKFKDSLKNNSKKKVVYIPDAIVPLIEDYLALLRLVRAQNPDWSQNDNLFIVIKQGKVSNRGDPIGADNFTQWFHKWCIKNHAELGMTEDEAKEAHVHSIRHSSISYEVNNGVELKTVSNMAGHSDIKITASYSHIYDSKKKSAANLFEKLYEAKEAETGAGTE